MAVPERYWRFPTRAAIDSLSARFGFQNESWMQDWEYQVADASRLEEFLVALEGDELTDDERFTLSQTVMQCFDDLAAEGQDVAATNAWQRFVRLLRSRPDLHPYTLCYWSALDSSLEDGFYVSGLVRPLWAELEPAATRAG
jgi:hypothetical protein